MRARSALFTLFGDVVMPAGGEAWLSAITAGMGTLGFNPQAVRTALHRMAAEGWVEPRREGRYAAYRTTPRGLARLEEAAQRIYRLRSRTWDGRWRMLVSTALDRGGLPAGAEGRGDDVAAELRWIGYGRLEPGVWVSPHDHDAAVDALLARTDVADTVVRFTSAATPADAEVARRAWDLDGLRAQHLEFLRTWEDRDVPPDGAEAFAMRLRLVHEWRKFLFLDPGLPTDLLPADWPGHHAAETFKATYERLLEPSWRWYRGVAATAAGGTTGNGSTTPSPFAAGLAALEHPT